MKDGPEDVLVLYFDEDIRQYVYEDQAGGQKYPVAKENVQFKELRNAKVHILETEGVTKQTAAKYAKYKNLKGLIISDPDPKKEIILDPETEIEVQLTNKYVTRIPWKFIKLLPIHDDMEDALSAAEPKTYRITSEKDSYHDFIGSGTLINAETVKLTLRGLNLEYAIPLAYVQEVSEDAVGKFDVGSKLQLSESITRGPLKRFKGRTAAITSWAGDKVTLQFQSGEFTFEAMKHIQYFKYFTKNEAKEELNYPRDEIESSSEASSQLTDDSLADDLIDDSQSLVSEADWRAAIGDIGATVKNYAMAKGLPLCLHLERALARANLEVTQAHPVPAAVPAALKSPAAALTVRAVLKRPAAASTAVDTEQGSGPATIDNSQPKTDKLSAKHKKEKKEDAPSAAPTTRAEERGMVAAVAEAAEAAVPVEEYHRLLALGGDVRKLCGINLQRPWAQLILDGLKTVEARKYEPKGYLNQDLWIIETQGRGRTKRSYIGVDGNETNDSDKGNHLCGRKRKRSPTFVSRIIGIVRFGASFQYNSFDDWDKDRERHRIPQESCFDWQPDKTPLMYGWKVAFAQALVEPQQGPDKKKVTFHARRLRESLF